MMPGPVLLRQLTVRLLASATMADASSRMASPPSTSAQNQRARDIP